MNQIKSSNSYKVFSFFNIIIMLAVIAFTVFPFIYLLAVSLSDSAAISAGKVSFFPIGFNLGGYKLVFMQSIFYTAYKNTLIYTFSGTMLSLIFTILCAYALSKSFLKGRRIIMMFIVFTMYVFPGLIPNYILISKLFSNSMLALIIPKMIEPYFMILMLTYFKGLPPSLEESAALDGLNPFKTLIYIVIPLSKPVIATIGLFYAVFYWNDWFPAMLYINDTSKQPVTLFLKNLVDGAEMAMFGSNGNFTVAKDLGVVPVAMKASGVLLVTIPILLVYPFIQKYFVKGAMLGSVKE